jgi:hypothetical protein
MQLASKLPSSSMTYSHVWKMSWVSQWLWMTYGCLIIYWTARLFRVQYFGLAAAFFKNFMIYDTVLVLKTRGTTLQRGWLIYVDPWSIPSQRQSHSTIGQTYRLGTR